MTITIQLAGFRPHQIELLRRTIAADCSPDEFDFFFETAQRSKLDPFRKQIVPLVLGKHNPAKRRLVIIITVEGQRVIAQRCGNYRAASEPAEYVTNRKLRGPSNPHGIELARVRLWQEDHAGTWFPVSGEAYWDEFAPLVETPEEQNPVAKSAAHKAALDPKSSWARMPRLMIAKCATAQALRAGWPDFFGGLYTEEEMERARLLDLNAARIADHEAEARRMTAAAGKDSITLCWNGWDLTNVPVDNFSKSVRDWIDQPGRSPGEIAAWASANVVALREFWSKNADEALHLKRLIEERSTAVDEPFELETVSRSRLCSAEAENQVVMHNENGSPSPSAMSALTEEDMPQFVDRQRPHASRTMREGRTPERFEAATLSE